MCTPEFDSNADCATAQLIHCKPSALASAQSGLAASAVDREVSVNECANACTPVCNSDAKPSGSIICDDPSLSEFDDFSASPIRTTLRSGLMA